MVCLQDSFGCAKKESEILLKYGGCQFHKELYWKWELAFTDDDN